MRTVSDEMLKSAIIKEWSKELKRIRIVRTSNDKYKMQYKYPISFIPFIGYWEDIGVVGSRLNMKQYLDEWFDRIQNRVESNIVIEILSPQEFMDR
jgi:hypothetical protein